ncbi:MAG: hypothetical protein ACRD2O_18210 [Terriglobia bacterium]
MPNDLERVMAEYEERKRREREQAKTSLLALTGQLRGAGVRKVCASFNGYGDEGTIEGVEFLNADGDPVPRMRAEQFPKLEDSFCPLLPDGYENNEGCSGTVSFDVEEGRVVVDANWNVTTIENQNYEV